MQTEQTFFLRSFLNVETLLMAKNHRTQPVSWFQTFSSESCPFANQLVLSVIPQQLLQYHKKTVN